MFNQEIWENRRVLITGHTGFKGSWLSFWLTQLGAKVIGYALDPLKDPNLFNVLDNHKRIIDHRKDIRDLVTLEKIIQSARPEIIIHMAAQSLVRESYKDPVGTYETNVLGTVNILEASRKCDSIRVILVITSDKCYENREINYNYSESDPMGGYDPYSSSKGCAELVTSAYARSFFDDSTSVTVASARAGNVIGGGDWALDRIIPDAMRAFSENNTLQVRHPASIRPWQHVLEPLSGYIILCEKMWDQPSNFSEGWNFGPKDESVRTVQDVTDKISELWDDHAVWKRSDGNHPHEATLLKLDITKAREQLGWEPKWVLETALEKTVSWYKGYYNGENVLKMSLMQIEEYQIS